MSEWNPWHGCTKISPGCKNCYVYRTDSKYGKDSSVVTKTANFNLPLKRDKNRKLKLKPEDGVVFTCFTSDFLLDKADKWRNEAWQMIDLRKDLHFLFITKRIDRLEKCLPVNWDKGYDNVTICCTAENQKTADYRLPIFLSMPIKHKCIVCEPLLERIDISKYLSNEIEEVIAGGESGNEARPCNYDWILFLRSQCTQKGVPFTFKQTGANFIKDGKSYRIPRKFQHSQARKANINT